MTTWKYVQLCDVCNLVAGFAFKSKDFGDYPDKVIKISNINPPFININTTDGVNVSAYDKNKLEKYIIRKGDYILAMTGSIGKIGKMIDGCGYINQRVLLFKEFYDIIDKNFLYYVLLKDEFMSFILNHIDSQTVQPNISTNSIGKFTFRLPPLKEQQSIAAILSCIDDKIILNNKTNDYLAA
jgi:type I restriction enzyme S subunit